MIGHDVGTQGSKSVLLDSSGEMLGSSFRPYPVSYPRPGWAEQDPGDWWRAVSESTRTLLKEAGVESSRVMGVGFAGQMIGVIPVDSSGEALRPAIIWLDGRADRQAERIARRLGGRRLVMRIAGAVPSGKDVVCKLAWIREFEPDVFEKTAWFLDTTGYLVSRATDKMVIDHTGAGGTGVLNNRTRQWSGLLARLTGLPLEKMPSIKRSIDVAGRLTSSAAVDMGLVEGTPVIAGMADIPAAAAGSGALENGEAHIYLGTSSWLCLSVSRPKNVPANGIVSVASADPDMFIMLGESETAGLCLEWFSRNLASFEASGEGSTYGEMDRIVAGVEPGAGRLIFAPWMFGERSPVTDTTLRGGFVNLCLDHDLGQMLRSVYEGIAYNLRWMLEAVEGAGFPCASLRAIGGGAKSDVWMQIMADVTGRRIEAVENPQEAGAAGCALAVAVALGVLESYREIKEMVRVRRSFDPDRSARALYDELYGCFRRLYPALSAAGKSLNAGSWRERAPERRQVEEKTSREGDGF